MLAVDFFHVDCAFTLIRKSSRGRANGTTGLPCVGGESGGGEAIDQAAGSMVTL
jgi:hypothetical protein